MFLRHCRFLKELPLEVAIEKLPDLSEGELGTCAIVGVADNLRGKGWGKQIDSHDFVARYSAKLVGYERDVGSKVGLRAVPEPRLAVPGMTVDASDSCQVDALLVKEVLLHSKSGKHTTYDEELYPSRFVVKQLETDLPPYRNPLTRKVYPRIAFGPDLRRKWRPTAGNIYRMYMDATQIKVPRAALVHAPCPHPRITAVLLDRDLCDSVWLHR
eukprot:scaffold2639_cov385-Prasinococcus_capsulatus_cf.AAC.16